LFDDASAKAFHRVVMLKRTATAGVCVVVDVLTCGRVLVARLRVPTSSGSFVRCGCVHIAIAVALRFFSALRRSQVFLRTFKHL
jgi:hypothetical protein